jgi:hypothetical protein
MKMEQIECSETSAYKIQTPGNHPEENIQRSNLLFLFLQFRYQIRQLLIASNLRIYKFVFDFAVGLSIFNKMDFKFVQ